MLSCNTSCNNNISLSDWRLASFICPACSEFLKRDWFTGSHYYCSTALFTPSSHVCCECSVITSSDDGGDGSGKIVQANACK